MWKPRSAVRPSRFFYNCHITAGAQGLSRRRAGGAVRYHCPDSSEFVGLLELDEGVDNPLPSIGAARDLQAAVAKWVTGDAPAPQPLDLLGSYGAAR